MNENVCSICGDKISPPNTDNVCPLCLPMAKLQKLREELKEKKDD